jgi:hypothetical protein
VAVLVRTDAAGATKEFAAHLHSQGVEFSVGASFAHLDVATALAHLPTKAWTPAYQARKPRAAEHGVQIEPRDGAWVAEATGLIELRGWPAGTRLILRKERPHPGAQLRITDADGLRVTGFLTNTAHGGPGGQLADLELRHLATPASRTGSGRRRTPGCATCPSTTPTRTGSGWRSPRSPRTCWPGAPGSRCPSPSAGYEPKRLRLQILATAGRLVRSARRRVLHIDSTWPWAETITTAHARLCALPVP